MACYPTLKVVTMSETEQVSRFDPDMPNGVYGCARCGNDNTEVVSADSLWCLDCRNFTTAQDRAEWLQKGNADPAYFSDAMGL